jgi:hypothetical protein
VNVLKGVVSSTSYGLEPDVFLGWPASLLVFVHSTHGFWMRGTPVTIQSLDDESPDFRFSRPFSWFAGIDSTLTVAYTPNAPPELIAHAFRVDLSCFWEIRGCDSVRSVVPLLLADRQGLADATAQRLRSANPCPDRILDGRVRTLPDLNAALLEVVNSRSEEVNEGDRTHETVTDYRLREVIRGHVDAAEIAAMHYRRAIPSPTVEMQNPFRPSYPKPGDRFLFFSGATFDSCRIVQATPSAELVVRTAVPAPKRREDQVGQGLM